MRILFLQDHFKTGGAARAANRLAYLLRKNGHEVTQVAGDEEPDKGHWLSGKPSRGWGRILECLMSRKRERVTTVNRRLENLIYTKKPDRIWFHNLAGGGKWGWTEDMITIARAHAPVLWTLHDMWALGNDDRSYWQEPDHERVERWKKKTGGNGQESRIERICGKAGKNPVTMTAPSRWLAKLTQETTGHGCLVLPNVIDRKLFSHGDQIAARRRLGLPEQGLLVLAGADFLQDRRKGLDLLQQAWAGLSVGRARIVLFGKCRERGAGDHYLGVLNTDEDLAAAYRAADLYVHPARMENAPCQIQESLACGTPVLAFAVGGIPEMVKNGRNGFLCSTVSALMLGQSLKEALADVTRLKEMREVCRQVSQVTEIEDVCLNALKVTTPSL